MKTRSIGGLVAVGFAAILAILALMTLTSFLLLKQIQTHQEGILGDALPGVAAMAQVKYRACDMELNVVRVVAAKSAEERAAFSACIKADMDQNRKFLADYEKMIVRPEGREQYNRLVAAEDAYLKGLDPMLEAARAGNDEEVRRLRTPLREAYVVYMKECDGLFEGNLKYGDMTGAASHKVMSLANSLTATLAAAGMVFGLLLSFGIVKWVNQILAQRQQAEQLLLESNERMHSLFAHMNEGFAYCRMIYKEGQPDDFIYVGTNQMFASVTGLQDVTGKRFTEVAPGIRESDPELLAMAKRVVTTGKSEKSEQFVNKLKAWLALSMYSTQKDYFVILVDVITERKREAEELRWKTALLEAQMEAAPDGILVADNHGNIILQNQRLKRLWSIPTEVYEYKDVIAQVDFVSKLTKDPTRFKEQVAGLYAQPAAVSRDEIELVDGTILERYTAPVRDKAGNNYGRIWTFRDITQSRQMENRLRQAQKLEAIGTLAGGIAHDFNNILGAIFGFSNLLEQDVAGNPAAQEDITEILKAANRAKDLVQQILTFSRRCEQKRQVIRLDSIIKEALRFLRASLPADIQIEKQLLEDAPAVLADPTQIYQVVLNLATNALHAMEGRGGRLTVRLDAFTPDASFIQRYPEFRPLTYARLTIADTGQGMDAQTMARIFEPFFTTKPVGKGTGLGLAVVHGIVQAHEGFIKVESQCGHGTKFYVYFPAQTPDTIPAEPATGNLPRGQGQAILLVDDEPTLTAAFQRLLERLNYQVTTSNNPRDAMGLFRENPARFALVITDNTMPEMNGLEMSRQIHALRPDMPVILASGLSSTLSPETLREAGIREVVDKPVSLQTLAEVLQRTLE
jgi:signal transduction histidine kinase